MNKNVVAYPLMGDDLAIKRNVLLKYTIWMNLKIETRQKKYIVYNSVCIKF